MHLCMCATCWIAVHVKPCVHCCRWQTELQMLAVLVLVHWTANVHTCLHAKSISPLCWVCLPVCAKRFHCFQAPFMETPWWCNGLCSTRLETRTKEFNRCASLPMVICECTMKVNACIYSLATRIPLGVCVCVWAYVLWPERWWTMPAQCQFSGNPDGSV